MVIIDAVIILVVAIGFDQLYLSDIGFPVSKSWLVTIFIDSLFGDKFIWNGYNLWMFILRNGAIGMVCLILIFFNQETGLHKLLLKE